MHIAPRMKIGGRERNRFGECRIDLYERIGEHKNVANSEDEQYSLSLYDEYIEKQEQRLLRMNGTVHAIL